MRIAGVFSGECVSNTLNGHEVLINVIIQSDIIMKQKLIRETFHSES